VDASSPTGGGTTKNYGRGGGGGPHLNDWRFNTSMACQPNRMRTPEACGAGTHPARRRRRCPISRRRLRSLWTPSHRQVVRVRFRAGPLVAVLLRFGTTPCSVSRRGRRSSCSRRSRPPFRCHRRRRWGTIAHRSLSAARPMSGFLGAVIAAATWVLLTGRSDNAAFGLQIAHRGGLERRAVRTGHRSLHELAALVAATGRVVCGDTAMAHLATAMSTPRILHLPPTSWPESMPPPHRPWHRVLQTDLPPPFPRRAPSGIPDHPSRPGPGSPLRPSRAHFGRRRSLRGGSHELGANTQAAGTAMTNAEAVMSRVQHPPLVARLERRARRERPQDGLSRGI